MKIVRAFESTAETQPQLQPALLRLSAIVSQCFTRRILPLLRSTRQRQSDIPDRDDAVCDAYHRSVVLQQRSSSATSHV
jgi:hypothetical protein